MNNYLQMLLDSINSVPGPGRVAPSPTLNAPPQTVDQRAQQKLMAAMPKPKQSQMAQAQQPAQQPTQQQGTPGNPLGQQAMDPVSQDIASTPNPNRPPMLPTSQTDQMGTPSSPGYPGYIGPFREGEPQGANPAQAAPTQQAAQPAARPTLGAQKPSIKLQLTPEMLKTLFEDHHSDKDSK